MLSSPSGDQRSHCRSERLRTGPTQQGGDRDVSWRAPEVSVTTLWSKNICFFWPKNLCICLDDIEYIVAGVLWYEPTKPLRLLDKTEKIILEIIKKREEPMCKQCWGKARFYRAGAKELYGMGHLVRLLWHSAGVAPANQDVAWCISRCGWCIAENGIKYLAVWIVKLHFLIHIFITPLAIYIYR